VHNGTISVTGLILADSSRTSCFFWRNGKKEVNTTLEKNQAQHRQACTHTHTPHTHTYRNREMQLQLLKGWKYITKMAAGMRSKGGLTSLPSAIHSNLTVGSLYKLVVLPLADW